MKLFLASLKSKFELIEKKVNQSPLVSIGEEKESTELRQAKFLRDTFIELIEAAGDEATKETSFIHSDNVKALQEELQEVSVAAKIRRRNELNAMIN